MKIYLALLVCAFIVPLTAGPPPSGINGFPLMVPPLFGFDTFKLPNCQGEKVFGGVFPASCTQMSPGVYRTAIEANQQVTVYECTESTCPLNSCNVTVVSFVNGSCDTGSNSIYAYYNSLPNITTPASAITFEQFISPCATVETSGIGYFVQSLCVPNGDGSYFLGDCQNTNSSLVSLSTCTDAQCQNCQSEMIIADDCANSHSMYHCPKNNSGNNNNGGGNNGPGISPPFWGFTSYLEPNCGGVIAGGRLHSANCSQFTPNSWKKATFNATSGEIKVFTCPTDKCDTNCHSSSNQTFINGTCIPGLNLKPYYSDTDFPNVDPPSGSTILRGFGDNCAAQSMVGFTLPKVCVRIFDHYEKSACDGGGISLSFCSDSGCNNCSQVFVQSQQCFHFGNEFANLNLECKSDNNNGGGGGGPNIGLPVMGESSYEFANCTGALVSARATTASCHPVKGKFERVGYNFTSGVGSIFRCNSSDCTTGCSVKFTFNNGTCNSGSKVEFWNEFPNIQLPSGAVTYAGTSDAACTQSTVVGFSAPTCVRAGNSFQRIACNGTKVNVALNCTSNTCNSCSVNLSHDSDKCNTMPDGSDIPYVSWSCFPDNTTATIQASVNQAQFSSKGDIISIQWVFGGNPFLPLFVIDSGLFPCSHYFSGPLTTGASCLWNGTSQLLMFVSSTTVIQFPANLTLLSANRAFVLDGINYHVNIVGQTITVQLPEFLAQPIPVLVTPVTVNSCFRVRLDGSKSLGVGLKFSWTIAPAIDVNLMSALDKPIVEIAPFAFTTGNSSTANYTILLTVSNIFGVNETVSAVITVNNAQVLPQVNILSDKNINWLPSFALRLDSQVTFPATCSFNTTGANLTFGWKVYASGNLSSPILTANQKAQLLIPGNTLNPGTYIAAFSLTFRGQTITDNVNLNYQFPAPVAILKPIAQKVGPHQNITLDASPSLFVTPDTNYIWSCSQNSSPCVGVTLGSTVVINVNSSVLDLSVYTFCVAVNNSQGSSSDCVTLTVIAEIPPLVAIIPLGVVNPTVPIVLKGVVLYLFSFSRLTFEWSVVSGSLTLASVTPRTNATTLQINANSLAPGATYTLKLTVTDASANLTNFATVTFTVNSPPTGGALVIDPATTGIQYNTTFSISCIGATDLDAPLSYRFGYQYEGETASYFIGSFQTASSTSTFFAKVGLVRIFVIVSDSLGSFTKIVSEPVNITRDASLDTKQVATDTLNQLTDILATGDATGALNTLASVGQLLGDGNTLSDTDKHNLGTNLIASLKTLTEINEILQDPSSVENVANTILLASQTSVAADLQKQALDVVGTLVGSGQLSESGARSLVGVLSGCFGSAGDDHSFVSDISDALHNLWQSQVGNLAPGQDPLVIVSNNLQLVAAKLDAFTSNTPITSGGSSCGFNFANPDSQGDLDIQMVSYNDDYSPTQASGGSKVVEVNLNGGSGNFEVSVTIPLKKPVEGTATCQFRSSFGNDWNSDTSCTLVQQDPTFVVCRCTHLTQFSIGDKAAAITPTPGTPGTNTVGIAVGVTVGVVVVVVVVVIAVVIYRRNKGKTSPGSISTVEKSKPKSKPKVKTTPVETMPQDDSEEEESESATESHTQSHTETESTSATSTSYTETSSKSKSRSHTQEVSFTSEADSDDS